MITTEATGIGINQNSCNDINIDINISDNNIFNQNPCNNINIDKNISDNNRLTKILGLNVCGLRSKIHNGIFDDYAKDFSILCLSEIKLEKNTDIDFAGTNLEDFHCYVKEKNP